MNEGHIFGDDGFRGVFGAGCLSKDFLLSFGEALGDYCEEQMHDSLYIGHDGRGSAHEIIRLISSGLKNKNIKLYYFGLRSTPSIAFPTKQNGASLGVMITASHFPPEYNGVKLFHLGYKLPAINERRLEELINEILKRKPSAREGKPLKIVKAPLSLRQGYLENIKRYKSNLVEGCLIIDAANGGASHISVEFSKSCNGLEVTYCSPNGKNINHLCGAIESEYLQEDKARRGMHLLLDGDADRVVIVDKSYGVLSSELLASIYLNRNCSKGDTVVCSEVVNTGFLEFCSRNSFKVELTPAGDRNVVEKALEVKAKLGFEPSGHFFIPEQSTAMDGLLFGIVICKELFSGNPLQRSLKSYLDFKREVRSYPLVQMESYESLLLSLNKKLKILQESDVRIFCRKSIWENVLRVYCDSKRGDFDFNLIEKILKNNEQVLL